MSYCTQNSCVRLKIFNARWQKINMIAPVCYFFLYNPNHMSINLIPGNRHIAEVRNTQVGPSAPSAPGLVDTLRAQGPVSVASTINDRHPIESRILNWEANQEKMKMETRRRMFGIADPVKREMELNLVQSTEQLRPQAIGGSAAIHSDILRNKDWSVDWEDIYAAPSMVSSSIHRPHAVHAELEQHFKI